MQKPPSKKLYLITVLMENGHMKDVYVRAATQKTAHRRALKKVPNAVKVQSTVLA